jgi:hypothetical protein
MDPRYDGRRFFVRVCSGVRFFLLLAACASTAPAPVIENRNAVFERPPHPTELRATVRIDAQPGGKKFQGVWLEFGPDKRFVVDYRPRWIWRGFENHEVLVTGHCYRPFGQAISATHFKVEGMRFATKPTESVPIFAIGLEVVMQGEIIDQPYPAGSKLAGSSQRKFRRKDGTTYNIASDETLELGPILVDARVIEVNMSHHAQTGGPNIWIAKVLDEVQANRDTPIACP